MRQLLTGANRKKFLRAAISGRLLSICGARRESVTPRAIFRIPYLLG